MQLRDTPSRQSELRSLTPALSSVESRLSDRNVHKQAERTSSHAALHTSAADFAPQWTMSWSLFAADLLPLLFPPAMLYSWHVFKRRQAIFMINYCLLSAAALPMLVTLCVVRPPDTKFPALFVSVILPACSFLVAVLAMSLYWSIRDPITSERKLAMLETIVEHPYEYLRLPHRNALVNRSFNQPKPMILRRVFAAACFGLLHGVLAPSGAWETLRTWQIALSSVVSCMSFGLLAFLMIETTQFNLVRLVRMSAFTNKLPEELCFHSIEECSRRR